MGLGRLGAGIVALVTAMLALLTGGVNTSETPAPTDDADGSVGADVTEPDMGDTSPGDSGPGTGQEPVVADDDGTDDSGDDGTANESGSENGALGTVETGDDDASSSTRAIRPRDSPVGVSNYNDGDGDNGLSNDSSSNDSTGDSSTDGSTGGTSSDDSTGDAGDDTGDGSGGGPSGSNLSDDIGMHTV